MGSTVTTILIPTTASIILNSFSSTDYAQEKLVVDTSSSKLFPIITSTTLSPTISTKTPSISTAVVTTSKASPGVDLPQEELNKFSTGTENPNASAPALPIYKAVTMIPESQFQTLSNPEINTSSEGVEEHETTSESGSLNKNLYPTNTEEKLLTRLVASSRGSTEDLFEKTVDLIKELTNNEVPEDILDFLSNKHKQVIESKGEAKTKFPNFKHKKFTKYYQNLDVKMKSSNLPVTDNILSALRQQLTASVLGNKRLRQKANNLPAYQPVAKTDKNTFRTYYKSKILKMMKNASPLPSQVQTKLQQELQESLADQFGNVQAQLEIKREREVNVKKKLEEELKKSLKKQLKEVLPEK